MTIVAVGVRFYPLDRNGSSGLEAQYAVVASALRLRE